MKITVFDQDNCGWCIRLHPHIKKLAEDSDVPLEFVNITNNWDLAEKYQFRSTPTVMITEDDVVLRKFGIEAGKGIPALITAVKGFITQ
jgi:thiol-disulfide isomerase/thioredoxin